MTEYHFKGDAARIEIKSFPIATPRQIVMELLLNEKTLTTAIMQHSEKLLLQGVETFEHDKNVIAAENGWHAAVWRNKGNQITVKPSVPSPVTQRS